jgi:hypothetical protein
VLRRGRSRRRWERSPHVDAIAAWGDEQAVRSRVQEHFDAGATHLAVQAIAEDPLAVELDAYRRVAPALLA